MQHDPGGINHRDQARAEFPGQAFARRFQDSLMPEAMPLCGTRLSFFPAELLAQIFQNFSNGLYRTRPSIFRDEFLRFRRLQELVYGWQIP
jgi:hypothetical protein